MANLKLGTRKIVDKINKLKFLNSGIWSEAELVFIWPLYCSQKLNTALFEVPDGAKPLSRVCLVGVENREDGK